ncbi:amino acid deaminase [Neptunicella sp. SCSIO 80796]|uniref:amino acid deaminase n=1 Tax=Neptunicella plasticusilytica TaxID=3117012 RepID=UPI003A4E59BE
MATQIPVNPSPLSTKGIGELAMLDKQGWNILAEEVSLPIAVLNESALQNNLEWMMHYTRQTGVKLAPHGKTTMAPELFLAQQKAGCWAMSLATAPQVAAASQAGIQRVIMANQLVGLRNMQIIAQLIEQSDLEYYCFVDSYANAEALNRFFMAKDLTLNILLEVGVDGGRCGVRDSAKAKELATQLQNLSAIKLTGLAFYEGVIHGSDATDKVNDLIDSVRVLAVDLHQQNCFADGEILLSGAGSEWYDRVAEQLGSAGLPDEFSVVIRPGCYLIHDTGIYQHAQQQLRQRSQLACDLGGGLTSSMQIWAYVQSVPESGLAIVGMGKRDVAFDAGLPTPELHYRPGQSQPAAVDEQWQLRRIMDQHAMLLFPQSADVQPGDIMCFSTSHPCLTMDKWRYIGIVDSTFRVRRLIETCF